MYCFKIFEPFRVCGFFFTQNQNYSHPCTFFNKIMHRHQIMALFDERENQDGIPVVDLTNSPSPTQVLSTRSYVASENGVSEQVNRHSLVFNLNGDLINGEIGRITGENDELQENDEKKNENGDLINGEISRITDEDIRDVVENDEKKNENENDESMVDVSNSKLHFKNMNVIYYCKADGEIIATLDDWTETYHSNQFIYNLAKVQLCIIGVDFDKNALKLELQQNREKKASYGHLTRGKQEELELQGVVFLDDDDITLNFKQNALENYVVNLNNDEIIDYGETFVKSLFSYAKIGHTKDKVAQAIRKCKSYGVRFPFEIQQNEGLIIELID